MSTFDPYDWSGAPRWAKYLAQDADGEWFWYANEPELGRWCWLPSVRDGRGLAFAGFSNGSKDWNNFYYTIT